MTKINKTSTHPGKSLQGASGIDKGGVFSQSFSPSCRLLLPKKRLKKLKHSPEYQAKNNPTVKVKVYAGTMEMAGTLKILLDYQIYCGLKSRKINGYFKREEVINELDFVYTTLKNKEAKQSTLYNRLKRIKKLGFIEEYKNGYQLSSYDTVWDYLFNKTNSKKPKKNSIYRIHFDEFFFDRYVRNTESIRQRNQKFRAKLNKQKKNELADTLKYCTALPSDTVQSAYDINYICISNKTFAKKFGFKTPRWAANHIKNNPFLNKGNTKVISIDLPVIPSKEVYYGLKDQLHNAYCKFSDKYMFNMPFDINYELSVINIYKPGKIEITHDY